MFDLEQAIAEWRQRMLAAGIQTPATLEELEGHMREAVKRQKELGKDESHAFALAVKEIGPPEPLKAEFRRARGFMGWLGEDAAARMLRVLSLLWLVYCAGGFFRLAAQLSGGLFYAINFHATFDFYAAIVLDLVYLRGMVASARLFGGNLKEKRVLWLIAILDAGCGTAIIAMHHVRLLAWFFTILGIVSVWLLRPARKTGLSTR